MKIVFRAVACVLIGTLVRSAPVSEDVPKGPGFIDIDNGQADYQRDKRLNNAFYAVSPCAAASASNTQLASFVPEVTYQSNIASTHPRYFTSDYGHPDYPAYWYRAEDAYKDDREIMRYSDSEFMDQTQMSNMFRSAPSAYMAMNHANIDGLNGQVMNPVRTAVFQNANVDGCNIPLLFSCSPSIVTGRIVNPETSFGYDPTPVTGKPTDPYGSAGHYLHAIHGEQTAKDHSSISSSISSSNVHNSKMS
ncbi:uncharacterized protein LOC124533393 [Vanessa cardui]|uniref:uncharacterized protein LOC124533393 n=1 Tax=Vanessa cardui TaxID=171605 RepID=UPI001F13BDD4|nr:uncharacterized protein LOC124533393 [Vanessa cardui]